MKAMILAAGYGTRLRPHTIITPKPAIPFLNIPLVYYALSIINQSDLNSLVVNTHYLPDQVTATLEQIPHLHEKLIFSHEAERPLGTGGGVKFAEKHLTGERSFAVINGDEVIFPSSPRLFHQLYHVHQQNRALATLLVTRHPKVGSQFGGVWADSAGRVYGFGKENPTDKNLTGHHFVGLQILDERIFDFLSPESNIFYDSLVEAIRKDEIVQVFVEQVGWFETGNTADFLYSTGYCLAQLANRQEPPWLRHMLISHWPRFGERKSLWEGADCKHEIPDLSQGPILLGNEVQIDPTVIISGFAVVGDRTRIGPHCHLHNCVIGPGLQLPEGVTLENDLYFGPVET